MKVEELKAGTEILYSGELIIMRDAAQKRIMESFKNSDGLPVNLNGSLVFYAGPAKTPHGRIVGAIGPTTSARMDGFLEMLFNLGVVATIGKGKRSQLCKELCQKYRRIYFVAPSGAAAALAKRTTEIEILAYADLGPEAIQRLIVHNFPLMVAVDSHGNDIFMK